MNRKDFFQQAFKMVIGKGLELLEDNPVIHALEEFAKEKEKWERPPGASSSDKVFQSKCTGCDRCMAACPVDIIMINDLEKRYPVIYPDKAPCIRCENYPCIQACPTGALILHKIVD